MTATATHRRSRPMLGLRHTPGRIALAVFRMPLRLYRHGWGWMLGRTFMRLVHVGRRSGRTYDAVAMVLSDDPATGEIAICSGWGPDADWVHNLEAGPAERVEIGREHFTPEHRFLTDAEAFDVAVAFRRRHPRRMRFITCVLGWGDLTRDDGVRAFIAGHPFVAFRPRSVGPSQPLAQGNDTIGASE